MSCSLQRSRHTVLNEVLDVHERRHQEDRMEELEEDALPCDDDLFIVSNDIACHAGLESDKDQDMLHGCMIS